MECQCPGCSRQAEPDGVLCQTCRDGIDAGLVGHPHLAPADVLPDILLCGDGAVISPRDRYRYLLWRTWGSGRRALFVMLNPSTADASADDPTIRRCIGFAQRWGCGGLAVANLYAHRATDPDELKRQGLDSCIGPDNDHYLAMAARQCNPVVVAWGARPPKGRQHLVARRLASDGRAVLCLGTTADGSPRHPLYLAADTRLEVFGINGEAV